MWQRSVEVRSVTSEGAAFDKRTNTMKIYSVACIHMGSVLLTGYMEYNAFGCLERSCRTREFEFSQQLISCMVNDISSRSLYKTQLLDDCNDVLGGRNPPFQMWLTSGCKVTATLGCIATIMTVAMHPVW